MKKQVIPYATTVKMSDWWITSDEELNSVLEESIEK